MNQLEQDLRAAYAQKTGSISPERGARIRAHDFHPRQSRLRRWPTIGVSATAVAAGAAAAIVLVSAGPTPALAGWTATPASVSAGPLTQARKVCGDVPATGVLTSESRGPFVAIVFDREDAPWQCITRGSKELMRQTTQYPARLYETAPAGKITTPSLERQAYTASALREVSKLNAAETRLIHHWNAAQDRFQISKLDTEIGHVLTGPDALTAFTGRAGSGVTAVTFILASGQRVSAVVQNGWYEAWWPGSAVAGAADAVKVSVRTVSGTRTSQMQYGPVLDLGHSKTCASRGGCTVFAPTVLKSGIAPQLSAHYAFFKNTSPSPLSAQPRFVRAFLKRRSQSLGAQVEQSEGIDNAQLRAVQLPGGHVLIVIPGAEGLCHTLLTKDGGGGGCTDIKGTMRWGAFGVSGESGPEGSSNTLSGLVPNGNKTVTVNLDSGKKLIVPVHDNVVYATFSAAAKSVSFKNAFGNVKRYPAG
ncbi:MAG TPA: hypothetical protein VHU61_16160 [Solirubrobacteraceae bacterium]|nr:hypothetical protein [Solirubrobacteraceae bacterium]